MHYLLCPKLNEVLSRLHLAEDGLETIDGCVTERISINVEIGTITDDKCDSNGTPIVVERVACLSFRCTLSKS